MGVNPAEPPNRFSADGKNTRLIRSLQNEGWGLADHRLRAPTGSDIIRRLTLIR